VTAVTEGNRREPEAGLNHCHLKETQTMLDRLFKRRDPVLRNLANREEAAAWDSEITLFTTSWCPSCRMAKSFLKQRGLRYQEVDIEEVPEAADQVMAWTRGYKTVPTMKVGKTVVIDWNRKAYEQALSEAGL
jgi:glutaredoxin